MPPLLVKWTYMSPLQGFVMSALQCCLLEPLGLGLMMEAEIFVTCPVQMSVLSLVNLSLIPSCLRVACTEVGRKNILVGKKGELAKPLCILNQGCKLSVPKGLPLLPI